MDLRDSPGEAAFRAEARQWLGAHAALRGHDAYSEDATAEEVFAAGTRWHRLLHREGWAAITWPPEYGGRGLGPIEQIIWNQELARAGIGHTSYVVGVGMAGPAIIAHGTAEQKARHLEPILRAEEFWCQLFSEPGAGSDLASLATRAAHDPAADGWVVDGQKVWSSAAQFADWAILLARTDPTVPKHRGITYFLLDMTSPGVTVKPLVQLNGEAHFNEVFLDGVHVPTANVLGEVDDGWRVAMTTLMYERMALGGGGFFSVADLLDLARAHPERLDATARQDLARVVSQDRCLELMNMRVLTALGRGRLPGPEANVMKLLMARTMTAAADLGLRLCGADAMLAGHPWARLFLQAPALHLGGGTDEVQRNVAGERALGLPKQPGDDRTVPFDGLGRS